MHLEKIEIFGFKSFADKTTIHFSKPVTAIVGPNGCGKSNVVDAFRWVLGGPTAKALRSDKMTDVIFSGTTSRKPLNYAQISLTFTKINKTLSVNYQEICISRRLYRTGESEWLINRNPVRLKDVHKLLWEAGLGKNAFYIFEQGKIDDLILATPLERRNIFEEAAKIMHFKEKRKEALRKLKQVEDNLKRVLDIQNEVNKQIEMLQKQADEAKVYNEQKSSFERLEKELVIAKWQNNDKIGQECQEKIDAFNEEQFQLKSEINSFEKNHFEFKEKKQSQAQLAKEAYAHFFEIKKSKELASYEFNTHQKKLEELTNQNANLKNTLQQFHQKHLQEHKLYLENQDKHRSLSEELEEVNQRHKDSFSALKDLETKVSEMSAERKVHQSALMHCVNSENQARMQLGETATKLAHTKEHRDDLSTQKEKLKQRLNDKVNQKESLEENLKRENQKLQNLQNELLVVEREMNGRSDELERLQKELHQLSEKMTTVQTQVQLLQKMKDEFEGYGRATKTLLTYSQNESHPLYDKLSPLSDWIFPKKEYEVCLSSLLAPYLQTLVVRTSCDLNHVIKVAQDEGLQGYSLLCLENISQPKIKQILAKSNPVSDHLLNGISSQSALDVSQGAQIVIENRFYIDHKAVLHQLSEDKNNLFLRENELRERNKEWLELEKQKEEHAKKYEIFKNKSRELRETLNQLTTQQQSAKLRVKEEEIAYQGVQREIDELKEAQKSFDDKKASLKEMLSQLQQKHDVLSKSHCAKQEEKEVLEKKFKEIEQTFEANFSSLSEKRSLKRTLEEKIKHVQGETMHVSEQIKVFESKSADFENQIAQMNQQIESSESQYHELAAKNTEFLAKEKELEKKLIDADKEYHRLEDALEAIELQDKELEKKLLSCRESLEKKQNSFSQTSQKLSQTSAENNLYFNEISEKFGLDIDFVKSYTISEDFTITKAEREVKRLRRSLAQYQEVNLKAAVDCKEKQERFHFLQCQIDDLNQSKEKLITIISELDNTSRQMFSETFENIRKHFKENYTLLFNGGEADLELQSGVDILEAGIEIIAQPPGKKMRSITQMSGGEKCLTALALLFALFETQSIPFCILDEVDAPLDDTNIERFTKVLKQFVKKHQFIIITHNKRTMAIADTLLGISMQEKGVTKVIPFEFRDQKEEALEEPSQLNVHA